MCSCVGTKICFGNLSFLKTMHTLTTCIFTLASQISMNVFLNLVNMVVTVQIWLMVTTVNVSVASMEQTVRYVSVGNLVLIENNIHIKVFKQIINFIKQIKRIT